MEQNYEVGSKDKLKLRWEEVSKVVHANGHKPEKLDGAIKLREQ